MDAQELQKLKEALELGHDAAHEVARRFHNEYKGYRHAEHAQVDADVLELQRAIELCDSLLAERAVSPAENVQSIDTPEFRELLLTWSRAEHFAHPSPSPRVRALLAILSHIDAQLAAAREDGFEAGKRHAHEQACKVTHALMADRDHWKANHADVVARLKIATERPDLPVDRIPAIKELERLQALAARQAPEPAGWREAMQEFVDRVERGEIRSSYTHAKFKALLAQPLQQEGGKEAKRIAELDNALDQTIADRDHYHEMADKLAQAIAEYFDADIGEHSSANCPWHEAIRVIEEAEMAAKECLQDVITHFSDFYAACHYRREACLATGDPDNAAYWKKQMDVLERMKAQATNALAPQPSDNLQQPRHKMSEMQFDDGRIGWYYDAGGVYIDVEKDAEGNLSVFVRDRNTEKTGWLDQADNLQQASGVCQQCGDRPEESAQRKRMKDRFAARPKTPATADFDLPYATLDDRQQASTAQEPAYKMADEPSAWLHTLPEGQFFGDDHTDRKQVLFDADEADSEAKFHGGVVTPLFAAVWTQAGIDKARSEAKEIYANITQDSTAQVDPAKKPVPPREQALCNNGQEPDWQAYAQEEAANATDAEPLGGLIMDIPCQVTPAVFAEWTRAEQEAYNLAHQKALQAAAEIAEAYLRLRQEEPAQATPEVDDDHANEWRRLALQFDGHRMQAIGHLKAMLQDPAAHKPVAEKFLAAGPLSGEEVLAQRIADLAAGQQAAEPVYQALCHDDIWEDLDSKDDFEAFEGTDTKRRILYRAAPPQQVEVPTWQSTGPHHEACDVQEAMQAEINALRAVLAPKGSA